MSTKNHAENYGKNDLADRLIKADLSVLTHGTLNDLLYLEDCIFKEYQRFDYRAYRTGRTNILTGLIPLADRINPDNKLRYLIDYVHQRRVRIGVYPGTFYPFHAGHMDILQKAELIFDKVIIAVGSNPEKADSTARDIYAVNLADRMYRQVTRFHGSLPKFIESMEDPQATYTIVKGLRNHNDFDFEKMQLRYMEDMDPSIKMVMIPCDRNLEHVSSSGIRTLEGLGPQLADNYKVRELKRK